MANLLTGDFDVVLQVSASTINRLLASMHQNAWSNPEKPSLPHSVGTQLGDVVEVDGVRGRAWAQVSVPHITLIDGATDRFHLQVSLRIRYVPDPDTEPLPTYIFGTLDADYALEDIDPNCPGWRKLAADYLWFRVVESSVKFTGTTGYDEWLMDVVAAAPVDEQAMNDKITRQLAALLLYKFEPAPQSTGTRFRKGSFKSLDQAPGEVSESPVPWMPLDIPIGGSAVAIPLGLDAGPPVGSVGSLTNVTLAGRDFGLAVSSESIMAMVEPTVDGIRQHTSTTTVTFSTAWGAIEESTVYHSSVNQASATWLPFGSSGAILISATGHSHTASILPDFDFSIEEQVHVGFDALYQLFFLWAGAPQVTVNTTSVVGLPQSVLNDVRNTIQSQVLQQTKDAITKPNLVKAVQALTNTAELETQLQNLDGQARADFDQASFHWSGIVVRGSISFTPRRRPEISFKKLDADGLSALDAWIPGGRIDRLRWSWRWFSNAHPPGGTTHSDRYVLRRERASGAGFLGVAASEPLPGLDGMGVVCVALTGTVVDSVTGQLLPVETRASCIRFGFAGLTRPEFGRLFVKEYAEAHVGGPPGPPVEAGLLDVTAADRPPPGTPNKLVVYVNERWADRDTATLLEGLGGCRRDDAGLIVMLVFREEVLAGAGDALAAELREIGGRLAVPVLVSEDVEGAWAKAFSVPTDTALPAWRLLNPDGGFLWMEDRELSADQLARVLDASLYPSPRAGPTALHRGLRELMFSPAGLGTVFEHPHPQRSHCPPWREIHPKDMVKVASVVSFARKDSSASAEELRRLRDGHGERSEDEAGVVVVLDGATTDEAQELTESLGPVFTVVGDPDGALARGLGVRFWPTTVTFDNQDGGRI